MAEPAPIVVAMPVDDQGLVAAMLADGLEQVVELEAVLLVPPALVQVSLQALMSSGCLARPWHQGGHFGARVRPMEGDQRGRRAIPVLAAAVGHLARFFGSAEVAEEQERDTVSALPESLQAVLRADGVGLAELPVAKPFWASEREACDHTVHQERASETAFLPLPARGTTFTFAELFAGVGGFRLALEELGGRCVFASEIAGDSIAVYKRNFGAEPAVSGDICQVDDASIPPHDLLVGGFPCQPFSALGLQPGLSDDKGLLFTQIVRVLRVRKPRAFLLENVPGILVCDQGRALTTIMDALEGVGYSVSFECVNARCLTAQSRKRVYFVGFRRGDNGREGVDAFQFPFLPDLELRAGDILESDADLVAADAAEQVTLSADDFEQIRNSAGWSSGGPNKLAWDTKVCNTLVSHYGRSPANGNSQLVPRAPPHNPRRFTPRECARLMGFPEGFEFGLRPPEKGVNSWLVSLYQMLGNAVCPPVIAALCGAIVAHCQDFPGHDLSADWASAGRAAAIGLALRALPPTKRGAKQRELHASWQHAPDRDR